MNRLANKILSSALACAVAVSLAACGGRGSQSALPGVAGAPGTTVPSSELVDTTFTITIPAPTKTSATSRRPAYISAATKSVRVNMTTSTRIASPGAQFNVVTNVTNGTGNAPGSPCTGSGPYTCTVAMQVPPGSDTFTFTTYDGTGGTGNTLSQQQQTLTVAAGIKNAFSITFDANAAVMTVNGSGSCESGPVGAAFGSVGTTPVTYTVGYTDPATKAIVSPGLPKLEIQDNTMTYQTAAGTITGTGGTVGFTINQSAQTFTLTPSNSSITSATINVKAVPANSTGSSDGLSFSLTKSFTFSTGTAPPAHNFLALAEQTGASSGKIDFYNLGTDAGGPVSFSAFSPASLAVTASTNQSGQNDVDNPVSLVFDSTGDLIVGNADTTGGNMACVPAGAISTGANSSTTVTTNVDDPVGLAYDSRTGTVAVGNAAPAPSNVPYNLAEFVLSGNYVPSSNDLLVGSGNAAGGPLTGNLIDLPAPVTAGTFALSITNGCEQDAAHRSNGCTPTNEVAVFGPTGTNTPIQDTSTYHVDVPNGIAYDTTDAQLIITNASAWHPSVSFYTVGGTYEKSISTYFNNSQNPFLVAANGAGNFAVAYTTALSSDQVQVYTNAAGTGAPTAVFGPIAYNATTDPGCAGTPSTYPYGATAIVTSMTWLSNTRLLVALETSTSAANGLYIYDISTSTTPSGRYDDQTCTALGAMPAQKAFQVITNKPLATAFKP